MTSSTIACLQCGQSNSIHRLWCATCGTPVASSYKPPVFTADPSVTTKTHLYERILEDLERLLIDRKVSRDTYNAIKSCYGDQLAEFAEQAAERNRAQARHRLVVTARQAAHSGRFQDAIDLLQQGLADDRGEHQLEEVIAEVNEKLEQRERVLQATREADALLREAKSSMASLRFEEAEEKLEQAQRLDPNNKQIIATRKRVTQAKAIEQESRDVVEDAKSKDDLEPVLVANLFEQPEDQAMDLAATSVQQSAHEIPPPPLDTDPVEDSIAKASFADDQEEIPSPQRRLIEAASHWSSIVKPFLLDNVGWFVGAFLVVAGFVVLIVTFWGTIEQNRILMHSLVYVSMAVATGMFFAMAYFMRVKYPQLENSSNVMLVIVALLIPLVFAAALLTSFVPVALPDVAQFRTPG